MIIANRCLLFAVFSRPPDVGEAFLDEFKKFLQYSGGTGIVDLVITGDFNFPHVDWSTGSPSTVNRCSATRSNKAERVTDFVGFDIAKSCSRSRPSVGNPISDFICYLTFPAPLATPIFN